MFSVSPWIAPLALVPAGAALAPEQREEGQPVRARVAVAQARVLVAERVVQPEVDVSPVGQRAALDDTVVVEPVEEQPPPRARTVGLVQRPESA